MPCLPLVGAFEVDGKLLATTESVALNETKVQPGAHTSGCLTYEIAFEIYIVGLVKHAVERDIKRVTRLGCVARSEREVYTREETLRGERIDGLLISIVAVYSARAYSHIARNHTTTHRFALAIIDDGIVATVSGVAQLLQRRLLAHLEIDVTDVPLASHFVRKAVGVMQTHAHLARFGNGVGEVCSIARLIIEETLVAQERRDTSALGFEHRHIKWCVLLYERF